MADEGTESGPAAAGRLRILTVTNMWPGPGIHQGNFVQDLVAALRRIGHEVDVEVVAQSRGRADYFLGAARVRRRAKRGGYDLVHIHFGMTAFAGRFVEVPRVLSLYGSDINVPWKRWMTKLGWGGRLSRIYVSRRLAATAGEPTGLVIANGVDFEVFAPGDRSAARADLGISAAEKVVLFGADPGRPAKGYALFSEVIAALAKRGTHARELILTEPGQPASRVARKMDAADVLLFTSRRGSEGSPGVVKEAIAMGLPVVSVDVGDVAELLEGVLPSAVVGYPSSADATRDREVLVQALADATARVLGIGERANGRERSAWLDLPEVAERMLSVYQAVVERPGVTRVTAGRPAKGGRA